MHEEKKRDGHFSYFHIFSPKDLISIKWIQLQKISLFLFFFIFFRYNEKMDIYFGHTVNKIKK
jgi:hypothetical protein